MIESPKSYKKWSVAWLLAIFCHIVILVVIAWMQKPDGLVHVSQMVPSPNQTVELMPAQGIEPAVFFSGNPEKLNPEAAMLYQIHDDGTKTLIAAAHLHPKRGNGLQFDAVAELGTYEIVVLDGELGVTPNFDGDLIQMLPSGDGHAGGVFQAKFKVAAKVHEIMTATVYEPDKPLMNEEPAALMKQPKQTTEQQLQQKKTEPQTQPPKPVKQPQKVQKTPQKQDVAQDKPTSPLVNESSGPVESGPVETNEPSPIKLTPQDLRLTPYNMAPELMMESARIADLNFAERDTNQWVQDAALAKKRYESAYSGPVVGIGQRGNSVEHKKSVAEYLALMHLEIHPLWAHGYLLRLGTIYRRPGAAVNDSDLEAVVEITLDSLGKVSDVRIVRSSGLTDYDSEAVHVAWNSSPGVAPPDEMRSSNGKTYIHWTFWRDGRQCGVFGVKVYKLNNNNRESLDFSLKAVQLQEKKLGLEPSVIQLPGSKNNKKSSSSDNTTDPNSEPDNHIEQKAPLPEKINPLED